MGFCCVLGAASDGTQVSSLALHSGITAGGLGDTTLDWLHTRQVLYPLLLLHSNIFLFVTAPCYFAFSFLVFSISSALVKSWFLMSLLGKKIPAFMATIDAICSIVIVSNSCCLSSTGTVCS